MSVTLVPPDSGILFPVFAKSSEPYTLENLKPGQEDEVLEFLDVRPIHTVFMSSLIRDHGLLSSHNRGSFYGCRDGFGQLEGVGLIGHATMIETRTENALMMLARLTRNCQPHLIRGEAETIDRFWQHYAHSDQRPRLVSREILLKQLEPLPVENRVDNLRKASLGDLDKILDVNASMALHEAGINPLQKDFDGFRQRTARRIEQGRIWVWVDDNRLIFKADIVAQTPVATYLEAVHVHPEERLKGYGLRCLAQLSSDLLKSSELICLTTNEKNRNAIAFYAKAGYQVFAPYQTIYLKDGE